MQFRDVTWLQRLLGFDAEQIPPDAQWHFSFTRLPQSWEVFALIGAVAALLYFVIFLYRREIDTCTPRMKMLLAGLRAAVLIVLTAVFLAPAVTYTQQRTLQPSVVVLRDNSQSMNTQDRYLDDATAGKVAAALGRSVEDIRSTQPARTEIVQAIFERDDRALLTALAERGKLRIGNFSNHVQFLETRPPADAASRETAEDGQAPGDSEADRGEQQTPLPAVFPPLTATGQSTDLHGAISEGLSDRMSAAVVLVTDGQHTSKQQGRDSLNAAAAQAREQGVPLLIVGVGDPQRPRNLQIADVYADPQVWKDAPFEIQAVLRAQDVGGETVQVQLIEHRVESAGTQSQGDVVAREDVTIPPESGQVRVNFQHTPRTAGRFGYSVRVEPVENEITDDDNQPSSPVTVKVLDQQARVLLISGSPTWEYQELQRLFERDASVNLSCWLQSMDENRPQEGNTIISRLPADRESLFQYDVILLLDPNPIEFDGEWVGLLKQFVGEHAGGVLFMAGPKFTGEVLGGSRTAALRDILPVRFGDVQAMQVASLLDSNVRAWPLGVVPANVDLPIMRFYAEPERSLELWKNLPGIYWSFPALESKPASRTLIEHSDPTLRQVEGARPLLVTGQYGSGRTVFMGFNNTWRWRRVGSNGEYFNRFWIQLVRYLVEGRSLEGRRRGIVETEKFRYEIGDRITITAFLKDPSYSPLEEASVDATLEVTGAEPQPIELKAVPNQPGQFEATLTARQTGRHLLTVSLPGGESGDVSRVETAFAVALPSVETESVWLDKALLVELAEASGGRYFDVSDVDALPAAVPDRTRTIELQSKPFPLWDTNRVLLLLVILLSLEWALRKRFKLL